MPKTPPLMTRLLCLLLLPVVAHAQPVTPDASSNVNAAHSGVQASQPCPDLATFYRRDDWALLQQQLQVLMPRCLQNSEYFALLGAAQLQNQQLAQALESLERALLLNPDNGAAQLDYAQALYLQGQLFTALEINQRISGRSDLPPGVSDVVAQRERLWRSQTRQWSFQTDWMAGYDDNLNGAPTAAEITITLPDDSIVLPLMPESRPIRGPYLNLRGSARYRQLTPEHQHNLLFEARGRVSDDNASDYIQLESRYALIRPGLAHSWQAGGGLSHLQFGGDPLYTASEVNARYVPDLHWRSCRPFTGGTAQHQLFHNQSSLNAVEAKIGLGLNCLINGGNSRQQIVTEFSYLENRALRSSRPGGDRNGWQVNMEWQQNLAQGIISARVNHTRLNDQRGYSLLLEGGAERWLERSYALLQYRKPVAPGTSVHLNLFYQYQGSNLQLFRSRDSSVEIGFSRAF